MFGGTFRHNLDSAGRFVMPLDLRNSLGSLFYVTKGLGCLCVFTREWALKVEDELGRLASPLAQLLNPEVARLHRHFFSGMNEVGTDKQNRVQLTPEHRRYAGIGDDVVICGCGEYIELWSPEAFDDYEKNNGRVEDLIRSGEALLPPIAPRSGEGDVGVSSAGPG
jgi:MraZ protein